MVRFITDAPRPKTSGELWPREEYGAKLAKTSFIIVIIVMTAIIITITTIISTTIIVITTIIITIRRAPAKRGVWGQVGQNKLHLGEQDIFAEI